MKKIIITIITVIIIFIAFFIVKNQIQSKKFLNIEKITEYNYFIYKVDDKFGVIDKTGKEIINANYSKIIIPNPQIDIFVGINGENNDILNSKGEKIFTEFDEIQPIKLKNVVGYLQYEKNVLKYKKNGQYGLIDFKGNILTKNMYSSIQNLNSTEGKFLISQNGKYGVIDSNGKILVKPEFEDIISDGYYTEEYGYLKSGFITSKKSEDGYKFGYVNYVGKNILENEYNEIIRISKKDNNVYLIVGKNGKYGFYKNSKKIINNEYSSITYDENMDLLILEKSKKFGVSTLERKKYNKY